MAIATCGSGNALLRHGLLAPCVSRSAHQGQTPLHLAALKGRETVCALLLDRGASLKAQDDDVRLCVVSVLVMLNCELLVCPRGYRRNDPATVS